MTNNLKEQELSLHDSLSLIGNTPLYSQNESDNENTVSETLSQEDQVYTEDLTLSNASLQSEVESEPLNQLKGDEDIDPLYEDIVLLEAQQDYTEKLAEGYEDLTLSNASLQSEVESEPLNQLGGDEYIDPLYEDIVLLEAQQDYTEKLAEGYDAYIAELSRQDDEHIAPISPYTYEL